jgi:O-antigen/teichoic acid export membrane protein
MSTAIIEEPKTTVSADASTARAHIEERSVKGFIGLGTAKALAQTSSWMLSILIARLLEPSDYGLMALAVFFVNFCAFISEFGLSSALIQSKSLEERDVHTSFWVMLAANAGIYLFLVLIAHPVANYYDAPGLAPVLHVLGLNFLISTVRLIPMCLLTRDLKFEKCAKAELAASLVSSVLMLVLAYTGAGVWALVAGAVASNITSAVMMLWYQPWFPRLVFEFNRVRGMLNYGIAINISKVLAYLSGSADNLIVGKVLGGTSLGLYNMAFVIGTMPTQKLAPIIHHIAFPVMSKIQDDLDHSREYFLSASRYLALAGSLTMFGMLIAADDFVALVLGPKWAGMVLPLRLLCSIGVMKALAVTLNLVLSARDVRKKLLLYGVVEVVFLSLAFAVGARFGINGVAAAWLLAYPILFAYQLNAVLAELEIPLSAYFANLKYVAIASVCMMVAMVAVRQGLPPGAIRLVVTCAAGVAVFGTVSLADRTLRDQLARISIFSRFVRAARPTAQMS